MKETQKNKPYLSPNDVAELLMVSPITVRQWAQKGWIKAEMTAGGHRRFLLPEVERFAQERGLSLQSPTDEKLRILIVDDNIELATYLVELFNNFDEEINVELAHNGFEAGQKVEAFKPTIVLLDLMMPGLDGFAVCHRLKADVKTRSIRVIAMTGHYSDQNIERILNAGAETCLSKPFKAQSLFTEIGLKVLGAAEV